MHTFLQEYQKVLGKNEGWKFVLKCF